MSRSAIALTVVMLTAVGFSGCGGEDSSDSSADDAATVAIVAANNQVIAAAKSGSAADFCDLIAPSQIKKIFGGRDCEDLVGPLLKSSKVRAAQFEIERVLVEGDTAGVQYKSREGATTFVKEDGKWYLGSLEP